MIELKCGDDICQLGYFKDMPYYHKITSIFFKIKALSFICVKFTKREIGCLNYLQNLHQGYPTEVLVRFLKARDGNVPKAHKMVSFNAFLEIYLLFQDS